jgi:hypothetical protein
MKDVLNSHKRRESKRQDTGWLRPATFKTAAMLLRLIDLAARVIDRLF